MDKMCLIELDAGFANELGEAWYKRFYHPIVRALHIDETRDYMCRDILSELLAQHDSQQRQLESLSPILQNKNVFIFGAGPSLDLDIAGVKNVLKTSRPVIIAADGAADPLCDMGFEPAVLVSDLDSCSKQNLELINRDKKKVFVHAHGDNIQLIRSIVPKLNRNILGTTQVTSTKNVWNFGGFTDGDRACYIASHFFPSCIVIAGMDFGGREGKHSKNQYDASSNPNRSKKLTWGKKSLEFLARKKRNIRFLNITRFGEDLKGITKVSYQELTSELA